MMQKIRMLCLLCLFLIAPTLNAQVELSDQQQPFHSYFNFIDIVNQQSDDPELSRLYVYWRIPNDELFFLKTASGTYVARYEVAIILLDDNNFQVDWKSFEEKITTPSYTETQDRYVYNNYHSAFEVEPDNYKVRLKVHDLETGQEDFKEIRVAARDFGAESISISDILIADSVTVAVDGSMQPHPLVNTPLEDEKPLFGYFYVHTDDDIGEPINVEISVRNAKRKKVFQDKRDFKRTDYRTPVLFAVGEKDLPYGEYQVKIKARSGKYKAELETSFHVGLTGLPVASANLETAIEQLTYVAKGKEMKRIKDAPPERKRDEFIAFWKRRDPTPNSEKNELMEEYYRRVDYASKHFGNWRNGWRSDRGMVYILLGAPDDVERNPYTVNIHNYVSGRPVKAYEVWHYYGVNRSFIFFDESGFGEYRLANPTALNDLKTAFR